MRRQRQRERGAIALLSAIVVIAVGGFLALSLNVGHIMNAKAQLQSAVDSGALAAARSLNGMRSGLDAAHNSAYQLTHEHIIDNQRVDIGTNASNSAGGDVEAGYWDGTTFYGENQTVPGLGDGDITLQLTATAQFFNAVRVKTGADGAANHNDPVKIFFGTFLGGRSATNIHATAIAVAGGPCTENSNVIPLVAASCALADPGTGDTLCDQTVTLDFGTGGPATVAFADLTPPSMELMESEVQQQLSDATGGRSPDIHVFNRVATSDGAGYSAATINQFSALASGGALFVLPVVNLGMPCTGAVTGRPAPVGFADVQITNVTWNPGVNKTMNVIIRCTTQCSGASCAGATYRPSDQDAGCAHFGFGTQYPPRLVK